MIHHGYKSENKCFDFLFEILLKTFQQPILIFLIVLLFPSKVPLNRVSSAPAIVIKFRPNKSISSTSLIVFHVKNVGSTIRESELES